MPDRVKMRLAGEDGNSFAILARFRTAAHKQGWEENDIKTVMTLATSGDYDHLLSVMMENTEEPSDG